MEGTSKQPIQPDVIITPSNFLKSFKRIAHCLREKKLVVLGITLKNENVYRNLIRDLESIGIFIEEKSRVSYKVGRYDAVYIEIQKISDSK